MRSVLPAGVPMQRRVRAFRIYLSSLRKKPVKPGDSWDEPYKIKLPKLGEFEGKRKYTFVGPDKVGDTPTLKITVDTDLSGDLDIDMGATTVTGTFETDSASGTVQFDPATGRILTMDSKQTFRET